MQYSILIKCIVYVLITRCLIPSWKNVATNLSLIKSRGWLRRLIKWIATFQNTAVVSVLDVRFLNPFHYDQGKRSKAT